MAHSCCNRILCILTSPETLIQDPKCSGKGLGQGSTVLLSDVTIQAIPSDSGVPWNTSIGHTGNNESSYTVLWLWQTLGMALQLCYWYSCLSFFIHHLSGKVPNIAYQYTQWEVFMTFAAGRQGTRVTAQALNNLKIG